MKKTTVTSEEMSLMNKQAKNCFHAVSFEQKGTLFTRLDEKEKEYVYTIIPSSNYNRTRTRSYRGVTDEEDIKKIEQTIQILGQIASDYGDLEKEKDDISENHEIMIKIKAIKKKIDSLEEEYLKLSEAYGEVTEKLFQEFEIKKAAKFEEYSNIVDNVDKIVRKDYFEEIEKEEREKKIALKNFVRMTKNDHKKKFDPKYKSTKKRLVDRGYLLGYIAKYGALPPQRGRQIAMTEKQVRTLLSDLESCKYYFAKSVKWRASFKPIENGWIVTRQYSKFDMFLMITPSKTTGRKIDRTKLSKLLEEIDTNYMSRLKITAGKYTANLSLNNIRRALRGDPLAYIKVLEGGSIEIKKKTGYYWIITE